MAFNNGPKLVTQGLAFLVDAADPTSYPGSGTTWTDVVSRVTGSISGSVSYTSSFYGGFNFTGPTASVRFDGTNIANYGSGSFTVELAFRPAQIQGIHYLISKNSGSFPSWGVYLSGSGGSGKLFSEFRISSTVSCSVSSSTTFVTGSNYQVDVRILPSISASGIFINGTSSGLRFGNGGGSLTSTGSFFIGNFTPSSSQAYSGSIYNTKIYSIDNPNIYTPNYNATAPRLALPIISTPAIGVIDLFPGSIGAYSTRRINSSYSGPALEVVNGSVSQSINYLSNGNLDTTSLLSFAAGGTVTVKTWYDQSGFNSNLTQTNASKQPIIVSSGVLQTRTTAGGVVLPTLNTTSGRGFDMTLSSALSNGTLYMVLSTTSTGMLMNAGGSQWLFCDNGCTGLTNATSGTPFINNRVTAETYGTLATSLNTGIVTLLSGTGIGIGNPSSIFDGGSFGGSYAKSVFVSDIIFYNGNLSNISRTSVLENINSTYKIF
jgi:hypothetical protein